MTKRLNLANRITFLRMILVPLFIVAVEYSRLVDGMGRLALAFFIMASSLDALDGLVARLRNEKTELGAFLDPLADRLLIVAGLILLVPRGLPVWVAVIVISRDVLVFGGYLLLRLLGQTHAIRPTVWGKATTATEFVVILVGLLFLFVGGYSTLGGLSVMHGLSLVMVFLAVASGFQYLMIGLRRLEE